MQARQLKAHRLALENRYIKERFMKKANPLFALFAQLFGFLRALPCASQSGSQDLIDAAWFNDANRARLLLAAGADPDIQDENGRTALIMAARTLSECRAGIIRGDDSEIQRLSH